MGLPITRRLIPGFLIVFSCLLSCCLSFNVDLNISYIVFEAEGSPQTPVNITFGYSVALYGEQTLSGFIPRVLIGAPTGNSKTGVGEGDLYSCEKIDQAKGVVHSCDHDFVDRVGKTDDEVKEGQWLGASISVYEEEYVVCAPRYIVKAPGDEHEAHMFGKCFVRPNAQQDYIPGKNLDKFKYSQAGMSVKMLKDKKIVYGAPGAREGNGALLLQVPSALIRTSNSDSVKSVDYYLGYSVTSGNFDSDANTEEIAGGITRADVTGKVLIYSDTIRQNIQTLFPPTKVKNRQEYIAFGASVCAVDLNNDGAHDLLVGAPFYSVRGDEGRVYVFINQKGKSKPLKPIFKLSSGENDPDPGLKGDNQQGSRFGTAIAAAGDLNFDGYPDVIIGAPLGGPDGNGAVYIYHGTQSGINETPQQIITAEEMSVFTKQPFKQFGYSIDGGIDTDNNAYPDIVIGSWGTDKALLLRTKPVMDIVAKLNLSRTEIPVENITKNCPDNATQCLDAVVCFQYNGKSITGDQVIEVKFELDPEPTFKRVYFLDGQNKKTYTMTKRLTIPEGKEACEKFTDIHVVDRNELILSSSENIINFRAVYSLVYPPKCYTELCPVLDTTPPPLITQQATLVFNCTDNSCDYDLNIKISTKQKYIVIGSTINNTLVAEVTLGNKDEKSYNPEVTIYHDSSIQYEKMTVVKGRVERRVLTTGNESTTELFRVFGSIDSGQKVIFKLQYSTRNVNGNQAKISIKAVAKGTSGKEIKKGDNNATLIVDVRRDISFTVDGTSVPRALTYPINPPLLPKSGNNTDLSGVNASSVGPKIKVTFVLTNKGESPLGSIEFQINYPFHEPGAGNEEQYIVYPISVKPTKGTCSDQNVFNPEKLKLDSTRRSKRSLVELNTRRKIGQTIKCDVDELDKGSSASFEFHSILWLPTLTKLHPNDIVLTIDSVASYRDTLTGNRTVVNRDVTIRMSPENVAGPAKKTPIWIIIVSVLGGILLLALLFFALFKFGFFKRNRPPKDISSPQTDDAPPVET